MEDRKQEFLMLKQKDISIVDYEREFLRLSRYANELVRTEADRCKRFLGGLRDEFQLQLMPLRITEYADLEERAKMIEQVLGKSKKSETARSTRKRPGTTSSSLQFKRSRESRECEHYGNKHRNECRRLTGGCFRCRSNDYFIKDCPKIAKATSTVSQRSESSSRGRRSGRSGLVARRGTRRTSENAAQQSEVRAPARAYVVKTRDERDAPDVVTDPESSHSYVNAKLVKTGNLKPELSRDKFFSVDLLIMPFDDFNIILGMDWLSEHGVILDCYKKRFTVQSKDDDQIEISGIWTDGSARIISAIKASEFPDVFPEEFPRLPSDREVEFMIEVNPGTDLVSIPPYRMSPTELKELKVQLQDLLDRVSADGIRVDPKKIEVILQWKVSRNVSEIALPMTKLQQKNIPFVWNDQCQQSFETLKQILTEASVLALPESGKAFVVYSYASLNRLGYVLMQNGKVIAYVSWQLKLHECKANVVADTLSRKAAVELRTMFARLSITDDGGLLAELRVKPIIFDQNRLCIPTTSEIKKLILQEAHNGQFTLHPEGTKMYRDLRELYWWPERIGPVAYRLALPPELQKIHDVFLVSMLRRYRSDPSHVISTEDIEIRPDLSYEEEPVKILARECISASADETLYAIPVRYKVTSVSTSKPTPELKYLVKFPVLKNGMYLGCFDLILFISDISEQC
ncbi:uncharacterized protein [Gossypium hirsutum]|uniref:Uncharacterized protein n=1 Tax=Gossypium hirsutum TaxID=3635 RepID=A0ABM2ZBT3_GOSHI|nr:uncharacterized protein LOC121211432 [Gossypium hirsutum]